MAGGEDIVIVRPAPVDKFGDPLPGGTAEVSSSGWLFAPGASNEMRDGQNSVDWDVQLYRMGAPGGEDIQPGYQIRVRGELFEVSGRPAVWTAGTVISLRRFTG